MKKFILWLVTWLLIMFIWICVEVYMDYKMVWEEIICDYRYVWWSYKWTVLAQKWDYIYLSWTSEVWLDCTILESEVTEDTPLCWTYIPFEWSLDTSNMNCYRWDKDIWWKLDAFKRQEDEAKKEEKRYYSCDVDIAKVTEIYNSCQTINCVSGTLKVYFKDNCPSAKVH